VSDEYRTLLLPAVWTFLHEVDQRSLHGVTLDFLDRDIISKNRPIFNVFYDVIEWNKEFTERR